MSSFPVPCTRLSVSFLSSFPVSLPQLFHRCFPCALFSFVHFAFGLSPRFAFFRPLLLGSDYSAFRLSFPFFPFSPVGGSFGAVRSPCGSLAFPLPLGLLPCLASDSVLSLLQFLSPSLSRPTVATSAPRPPFRVWPCPPLLSLRAPVTRLSVHSLSAVFCCCLRDSLIMIPQQLVIVNNFFKIFLYIFTICQFSTIYLLTNSPAIVTNAQNFQFKCRTQGL